MSLWSTKRERAELERIINEKVSAHGVVVSGAATTAATAAAVAATTGLIAAQHTADDALYATQSALTAEAATARTNEANASFLTAGTVPDARMGNRLVGWVSYAGGTDIVITPTNGTSQDVDATNVAVTFTAPASGVVTVLANASYAISAPAGLFFSLREGASDLAGTKSRVCHLSEATTAPNGQGSASKQWIITGLTPGSSHTYKMGCAKIVGAGTADIVHGPDWGPITMTIRA